MGVALFLIGCLAVLAGIVLLVISLVRKKGWGIIKASALHVDKLQRNIVILLLKQPHDFLEVIDGCIQNNND